MTRFREPLVLLNEPGGSRNVERLEFTMFFFLCALHGMIFTCRRLWVRAMRAFFPVARMGFR